MERERSKNPLFMWVLVAVLVSQNLVIPVMCRSFEDEKNYYSHDPHTPSGGSPPRTPSHGTTPPHSSGGGYGGTPPSHSGGGSYDPTPSTPSGSGGGGYYHSPPSGSHSPPITLTPPSTPIDPNTPTIPFLSPPSTPMFPDPNTPPAPFFIGTCNYWKTHPEAIWGLLGWWGTVGGVFGVAAIPAFGTNLSLQQALANTRTDGIGALYREGTASLLNSMVSRRFPFTTKQVRDSFGVALVSNKAAAAQAQLFKLANEGRLKPRT